MIINIVLAKAFRVLNLRLRKCLNYKTHLEMFNSITGDVLGNCFRLARNFQSNTFSVSLFLCIRCHVV